MTISTAQLNVVNRAKALKRSKNQTEFERNTHLLHLAVEALEILEKRTGGFEPGPSRRDNFRDSRIITRKKKR